MDVPDTILPVQFFDRTRAQDAPEKRLIFAVLLDAIVQLRRGDTAVGEEAERWIYNETDDAPLSFVRACEVLEIDAENLARGLLSWRATSGRMPGRQMRVSHRRVTPSGRKRRRVGAVD